MTNELTYQSEDLAAALGAAINADYRGANDAIRRVVGLLNTPPISDLLQRALPEAPFNDWFSAAIATGGGRIGTGRLSWPVETGERVALQLALLRALAEGKNVKLQPFLMRFFGSKLDAGYGSFSGNVLVPFGQDLERLLNRTLASDSTAEPERTDKGTDNVVDKTIVFVVHGRNGKARAALFAFLRAIHLHPLEWSEALALVPGVSPYVGDVLDAAFLKAQAIVVLLSGDDEAQLREAYRGDHEEVHETTLTPQARANVLFEAGLAFGTHPARTVLVELGRLRPFSDIGGRHTVRISNAIHARQDLAQRLRKAGCAVNLDGTDWHVAGDFDAAIALGQEQREPTMAEPDELPVELFLGTTNLASGVAEYHESVPYVRPPITVRNRTSKQLPADSFRVGVVCGREFPTCRGAVTTLLPDGRSMHVVPGPRGLFPGESFTFDFDLSPDERKDRATVVTVRVLTAAAQRDFPLTVIQAAFVRP